MYMVVLESDDGLFLNDPQVFDTKEEAREFVTTGGLKMEPGEAWMMYSCRYIETIKEGE
jgi:hypothetical protein